MDRLYGIDVSQLTNEASENNGSKEYFHIVTRRTNGRNNNHCSSANSGGRRRGRKRGRKTKWNELNEATLSSSKSEAERKDKYEGVGGFAPSLMVNERQRRKLSSRFKSFLEVLKGEKEFYIDNEEDVETCKRGRGRKKRQAFWDIEVVPDNAHEGQLSFLPEAIDEFSDKTCVIHVKENVDNNTSQDVLQASVEDGNACVLKSVVQEVLSLPSRETPKIISGIEQLEEKTMVLMDVMSEDEVKDTNAFPDFKEMDLNIGESIFGISDVTDMKTFQISDTMDTDVEMIQLQYKPESTSSETLSTAYGQSSFLSATPETLRENTEEGSEDNHIPAQKSPDTLETPAVESDAKKFRCKLCYNTYSSFADAQQHAKTFHRYTVVEARMNKRTSESYFKCPDCEREFPTEKGRNKHHLLMHLKNHSVPTQCPECNIVFNTSRTLERHLREIHDRNTTHFCDICEEEFVLGTSLEYHIAISHPSSAKFNSMSYYFKQINTRKTLYQCPLCNKVLVGTKAFRAHHEKVHNGEAFGCKQCKFKTPSASVLKRHLASVHKAIDISLFVCSLCKVGYQMAQDLEEHYILFHNRKQSLQCSYCGDKFACNEMLRFHKGKHRAFPCDFCPISFMKQETLEEHLETVHKNDLSKEAQTLFEVNPSTSTEGVQAEQLLNSVEPPPESKILEINLDGSVEVQEEPLSPNDDDDIESNSSQNHFNRIHHLHNTKEGTLQEMDIVDPLKGFRLKDLPKKINCPICSKLLTTKFLRTHMRSHQGSFPHKCSKCSKAYAQGTLLRKHIKSRHYEDFLKLGNKLPKKKKVQCEYCDLVFEDIYLLEEHLWSHMDEKSYECESCRIKFGMKVNWMEHFKTHYFKEEKQCPDCSRTFKSVGFYREHIERCQTKWTCEECGFKCENPELYRKHKKIEHARGPNLHRCPHCDKTFCSRYAYEDHLLRHSSKKEFVCQICSKEFKRQRPLNDHIARVHSKTKYICSFCGLSFDFATELQVHARDHRRVEMTCKECDAIYLSREALDNHAALYHNVLNQDPFICSFCSEVFTKQVDLKLHLPTHMPDTPLVCQVNQCHKMFRKEALLRSHMARRHSYLEYFCPYCDRKFLLDSDLSKHIETHKNQLEHSKYTEDRPYECSVCGSQLAQKLNMISHIQTVHNLKNSLDYLITNMWKCSVCEKVFLSKMVLLNHLEQHAVHGVQAEGTLIKSQLPYPVTKSDDSALTASSVAWADLLHLLKVEVIALADCNDTGEAVKLAMNTWQCCACFFMTSTEENIKKHVTSNISCLEGLIALFTSKTNNDEEQVESPTNATAAAEISEVISEDFNLQSVMVDSDHFVADSKDAPLLLMDNNLQLVMSPNQSRHTALLSPTVENSGLTLIESGGIKDLQQTPKQEPIQIEVPTEFLTGATGVLNSSGVLIQIEDGRLVIPEMGTAMAQYHLVKEETDNRGTTESTYEIFQSSLAGDELESHQSHTFAVS